MEDEGVLFEGLRLGSAQAFEELLRADDPAMRRLALLYVPEEQVTPLVHQTWSVALPGLDMFTWHTTLRAWLTGILVTYGRAWRSPGEAPGPVPTAPRAPAADPSEGPLPWASLGWSSRWGPDSWGVLEDALAGLPLDQREVLWLHDVEGWSWREVLDTLGLTGEQGADLLLRGRSALAATVAAHVGAAHVGADTPGPDGPPEPDEGSERLQGVAHLLGSLRPVHPPVVVDQQLLRSFGSWRRQRGVRAWRRWRWELRRARG